MKKLFTQYKMLALLIAIALIWAFFSYKTEGGFMTPRNMSNLMRQMAITGIVMFFILFVAGNAMAQSVRERINELGVLKTLGFGDGRILSLVLLESCTIAIVGGGIGLLLSWMAITLGGDPTGGLLPIFHLPPRDLILGTLLVLILGVGTGLLPAWQASRLKIVDALRRN